MIVSWCCSSQSEGTIPRNRIDEISNKIKYLIKIISDKILISQVGNHKK